MTLGPHAPFIIAAYAVAATIVAGLIAWVIWDYRTQRRLLAELDARGVVRRSEQALPRTGLTGQGSV
ncbi:MAG: heme exporter protein CcmD [Xanthobacteraceae bacterium]